MAAFSSLEWTRFDVWALLANNGVAVVEPEQRKACHDWLAANGYSINTLDFGGGIGAAKVAFGQMVQWEAQFGYSLTADRGNLDAIHDGFKFETPTHSCVLELLHADSAYREDSGWLLGFLSIAAEYSRNELALGHHFFAMLALPQGSALEGVEYRRLSVPFPFRSGGRVRGPFEV